MTVARVKGVGVVYWAPRRWRTGRLTDRGRRLTNFGDMLGPWLVRQMIDTVPPSCSGPRRSLAGSSHPRLVTVGSVIRLAADGDVVWGTGVNGKTRELPFERTRLDIRAVRGPLTREWLIGKGFDVPEVFGDPGLLTARFAESVPVWSREPRDVLVVPNLHDYERFRVLYGDDHDVLNPLTQLDQCIARIRAARFVTGSSLHGICIAESFGVPARLMASSTEPAFKYEDYFLGSGREVPRVAHSVDDALSYGGAPPPQFDEQRLLAAFPHDLWGFTNGDSRDVALTDDAVADNPAYKTLGDRND